MAERKGRLTTRRLKDYEARRKELVDAFNLPGDLRTWVTVRLDDDEGADDVVTIGAEAGLTKTVVPFPMPAEMRRLLRAFLADHREDLETQLKLDLATNLLAAMSGANVPDEEE